MHSTPQPRPFGHLTAAALAAVLALPLSGVVMAQSQTETQHDYLPLRSRRARPARRPLP